MYPLVVCVDSQEVIGDHAEGWHAVDGNLSTIWHTRCSGANVPGYPHSITLDLGQSQPVYGLTYTPR